MADSNGKTPLGYGHDKKGAAGGEDLGAGKPAVAHTAPVDAVSGKGSGPKVITFTLDGKEVSAREGETIWQVAKRLGTDIPHLCYSPEPGYRADGNCRACMVEIEGERVLAASCIRKPAEGMKVKAASERAKTARAMVFELLISDQPDRKTSHDPQSKFWAWADRMGVATSRFGQRHAPDADRSHPAMAVNLDACIQCNLCVRACREVQVNDVIGMAGRGHGEKIVFDFDDPMGNSTCVACGECVQACPTGALMPATLVDVKNVRTELPDRAVHSVCPYCGVGCQLTYHIKNDKLLYVSGRDGPANQNRLCVKGRFGFDYVSNPQRLMKPMVRKDGVKKAADDLVDPANPFTHFREATWEEAMARAASGLKKIRDRDGPRALAGFGSAKGSNEEAYLFQKLVRTGFGSNNVDHCTRLCHASSVAALLEGIGSGAVSNPVMDVLQAEVVIVIGANPTVNHPVAATWIKNAVRKGTKLVVCDPRRSELSRHAWRTLQFKADTDVALLNAMMHVIVAEGLADREFIASRTSGYEALAANVAAYSPEAMAPLCGIDADTIREVARLYATAKASMILWGMGISQHVHGTDNARCLIALALLTGQIGRPGTGLRALGGQKKVQGASDAGVIPMMFPGYQRVAEPGVRERFAQAWNVPVAALDDRPGLTVVEVMEAILAGAVKGMYIMGENPAMSDPDANHAREALAALDLLVVQDIFLTETAYLADVILPAGAFPEKTGTFTNTDRLVQLGRQAIDPPGEARQDLWIVQQIARRMGLDWDYGHVSEVFDEMRRLMPSMAGITWARLERDGAVVHPCPEEDHPGTPVVFTDSFPREDGRARFVPADIIPADERPDADYPMVLITGRQLEHWHTGSMTRRATVLDAIEPDPIALVYPLDLAALGVAPGGVITLASRRGEVALYARADDSSPPGAVFVPFCYYEAAINKLTNAALDPFGKIPEFKYCAIRIAAGGTVAPQGSFGGGQMLARLAEPVA